MKRRTSLFFELFLLAFFGVFLLYPLAYVFPGAVSDADFRVELSSLGDQPSQRAQVIALLARTAEAGPEIERLRLPYVVRTFPAQQRSAAEELARQLRAAGAQAEVVRQTHWTLFYF